MLPRKRRVRTREFKEISNSRTTTLPFATLRITPTTGQTKVSFVVSKKVSKTAIQRNKFRRLGYNTIKEFVPNLRDGSILIFYLKKEISLISKKEMSLEIKKTLSRLGILKN